MHPEMKRGCQLCAAYITVQKIKGVTQPCPRAVRVIAGVRVCRRHLAIIADIAADNGVPLETFDAVRVA